MEKFKNNDGLDFVCENCGDREDGCFACGYGKRQKRESKDVVEPTEPIDNSEATPEELDQFFKEMKDNFRKEK